MTQLIRRSETNGSVDGAEVGRLGSCHEPRVEIAEELRVGVARETDHRGSLVAPARRRIEQELRALAEHLLGAELDRGTTEVLIPVANGDALRAGAVGLARDGADDRCVLDQAGDDDLLAGLDVRADPDGELRVAAQPLARRPGAVGSRSSATGADGDGATGDGSSPALALLAPVEVA